MSSAALHRNMAIDKRKSGFQSRPSVHNNELKALALETSLIEGV
jgi:hypothetical protein